LKEFPIATFFLLAPDTDFRDFLEKMEKLARFVPEIIKAIEKNLNATLLSLYMGE